MLNELNQFIDVAQKNRKYAPNTATGIRVALSIFTPELNEQERESFQTLKEHMESIYLGVYRKNQKNLSSKTLMEYKRRILRLISDYEQYGNDPNKMAPWSPVQRRPKQDVKQKNTIPTTITKNYDEEEKINASSAVTMNRFELSLRPGIKAIVLTPADLTADEANTIKKYIEYLESVSK